MLYQSLIMGQLTSVQRANNFPDCENVQRGGKVCGNREVVPNEATFDIYEQRQCKQT